LQSDRSDKLTLTATGTGGLAELRDALEEARGSYAYARVSYANDKESRREKFVLIVWIGPGCKVMRKAKVSHGQVMAGLRLIGSCAVDGCFARKAYSGKRRCFCSVSVCVWHPADCIPFSRRSRCTLQT
jgi:hypothetical protein